MTLPTLIDIANSKGTDGLAGLIEEVIRAVPEVRLGAARTIKGVQYKANIRTGVPSGGFRAANAGVTPGKSTFEQRLIECAIANCYFRVDKAVAMSHEDGLAAYLTAEAKAQVLGQMIALGSQFYYGTLLDSNKGFPGLGVTYDATNMTVDATGSTADTGSSVWFVKWGDDGVQWLYGNGENPLQLSEQREETGADPNDSTKILTYISQELLAWVGLKQGSLHSAVRIKNLTAQTGKGLTDLLLYDGLSLFPTGWKPDVCLMNRRSLKQLRASRTATNPSGTPAPIPTEIEGIPIEVTDSIVSTEAIV